MKVAELSQTSGISVATIKYYVREGLLPAGERTSATQAQYEESHVRRLSVIRALIDIGGLSVARTAHVLAAMDDPAISVNQVLGTAQQSVTVFAAADAGPLDRALGWQRADALIARRGWQVSAGNPGRQLAADVLATFDHLGMAEVSGLVEACASAAEIVAEADLEAVVANGPDRESMVETVVIGTVLGDVLLMAMRRLAQEHQSGKQFPDPDCEPLTLKE